MVHLSTYNHSSLGTYTCILLLPLLILLAHLRILHSCYSMAYIYGGLQWVYLNHLNRYDWRIHYTTPTKLEHLRNIYNC
jgi:hypothetical protein